MTSKTSSTEEVPNRSVSYSSAKLGIEERIRRRAYQLYEQRGCQNGHAEEDWLLAEQEVCGSATRTGRLEGSSHR